MLLGDIGLEAELVRDNILYATGQLDSTMGGPEIDQNLGLVSRRRSIYLRIAPEKEVEFLKIFDGPAVTECYLRRPTVVPQQALALANSELTRNEAKVLVARLEVENRAEAFGFGAAGWGDWARTTPRAQGHELTLVSRLH